MKDVTVIVPVGPGHTAIAERAIESAKAQTVPVEIIIIDDKHGSGPSWARNQGIAHTETPWVTFLDADDELLPTFTERMLAIGHSPTDYYVYSDWLEDEIHHRPPDACWCGGSQGGVWSQGNDGIKRWMGGAAWHVVTTLLPTHWVKHIGGFDEGFNEGGEDTEFYWKLVHHGCCGIHVPEPLFRYNFNVDGRSQNWVKKNPNYRPTMMGVIEKYGGIMSGCCGQQKMTVQPTGARQEGDVLVQALWRTGKRKTVGAASGRVYPRASYPMMLWLDPRDLQAMPNMFKRAVPPPPPPPPPAPSRETEPMNFAELTQAFGKAIGSAGENSEYRPVEHSTPTPDPTAIIQMGQAATTQPAQQTNGNVPNPAEMTVKEAKAWVSEIMQKVDVADTPSLKEFYRREKAGKERSTLLAHLEDAIKEMAMWDLIYD